MNWMNTQIGGATNEWTNDGDHDDVDRYLEAEQGCSRIGDSEKKEHVGLDNGCNASVLADILVLGIREFVHGGCCKCLGAHEPIETHNILISQDFGDWGIPARIRAGVHELCRVGETSWDVRIGIIILLHEYYNMKGLWRGLILAGAPSGAENRN